MEQDKAGMPPPYNAVPPQPQQPPPALYPPVVSVATVSYVPNVNPMGSQPQGITCRSCNMQVVTQVKPKSTTKTHLFALLLCVVGCIPCMCIPYCMDSCKNLDHYCPNCESYIGTYVG